LDSDGVVELASDGVVELAAAVVLLMLDVSYEVV
jgi:hypothetical protein